MGKKSKRPNRVGKGKRRPDDIATLDAIEPPTEPGDNHDFDTVSSTIDAVQSNTVLSDSTNDGQSSSPQGIAATVVAPPTLSPQEMPLTFNPALVERLRSDIGMALSIRSRRETLTHDMRASRIRARLAQLKDNLSFDVNPDAQSMIDAFKASTGSDPFQSVLRYAIAELEQGQISFHLRNLPFDRTQCFDPMLRTREQRRLAAETCLGGLLFPEFLEDDGAFLQQQISQELEKIIPGASSDLRQQLLLQLKYYYEASLTGILCAPIKGHLQNVSELDRRLTQYLDRKAAELDKIRAAPAEQQPELILQLFAPS
ncbi:MAG: hypothetical protein SGARI_003525, partial [Bacillariaceae sp.]